MFSHERQNAIRKIVQERQRVNFTELHALVPVSQATLRRDLSALEAAGEVIRVHGGVLDPRYVRSELSFDERLLQNGAAKRAIAKFAAACVPAGASVFVDAGSTCLETGKLLLGRADVRLVTHSAALVAAALHGRAPFLCLGGELRQVSGALVGGQALGVLRSLHVDIAFVGASGLDPEEGCSTTELSEAEMKQAILRRAARKILLADGSKWNRPSTVHFAAWNELDDWVTDQPPGKPQLGQLRKRGLVVHLAAGKHKDAK
jgi:DeoR/GlpR family transcriptional regulator of sugar metabolism